MSKTVFTKKKAKEIALRQFGQTLDAIIGYSDPNYTLKQSGEDLRQNLEEDLADAGYTVTENRTDMIITAYDKFRNDLETHLRKRYKEIYMS